MASFELVEQIRETAGKWFSEAKLVGLVQWQIKRSWPANESRGWATEITDDEARAVIRFLLSQQEILSRRRPSAARIKSQEKQEKAEEARRRSREMLGR